MVDGDRTALPAAAPSLSVRLADDVTLVVRYHGPDCYNFDPTISAPSVDRDYQTELINQLKNRRGELSMANGGKWWGCVARSQPVAKHTRTRELTL